MVQNCMIAGVGGQGTVLASKLMAEAALRSGLDVRTTETIGMAQRGGSVVSHVRMGTPVYSPLVPPGAADLILAFEPAEAVRLIPFLRESGRMIVCDSAVMPVTSALSGDEYKASDMIRYIEENVARYLVVDGGELLARCGSAKTRNVALLGFAAAGGVFPFGDDLWEEAIRAAIAGRYLEMNLRAFAAGRELYYETVRAD